MLTKRFDKNNYYYNQNSKIGFYLIHGFSSTTYEMIPIMNFLKNKGFKVVANNLPGHGTTIEECNRVKYQDWLDYSKKHFAEMASSCDKTFIIGSSMGSVIALYLASIFPIDGLIIGGTVISFRNSFTVNYLNPLLSKILKSSIKTQPKSGPKIQFYGYNEYPLIALNQFRKMIKYIEPNYKNIKTPTLIIHSENDRVSSYKNIEILKQNLTTITPELLIIKQAHHNLFDNNPDFDLICEKIDLFIHSITH